MKLISFVTFTLLAALPLFSSESTAGPSPEEALAKLKAGNERFLAGTPQRPNQTLARAAETSQGQHPYAAVLGCADSRAALDVVFDAGIGDLFTIRVAGNVADVDEIASLEYGAEHLGVPLILVLGHTSCGAVTAVVKKSELGGQLPGLLDNIQAPAARAVAAFGAASADLVDQTARENVLQSIQDLLSRSKILASLVEEGKLQVIGGLHHLDTATIEWMGTPPAATQWVAAGLKSEVAERTPETAAPLAAEAKTALWTDRIPGYLGTFFGSLVFLLLVQVLFVAQRRAFQGLRIRGRLIASYAGLLVVLIGSGGVSLVSSDAWPFVLGLVPALVFSVLYSRAHYRGFEAFYQSLKQKWEAEAKKA